MSDVEASPRPWKIRYEMNVVADRDGGRGIVCSNATVAACGGFSSNMKNTTDENRANACLIVRAVNSHERLVEALRYAIGLLDKYADDWGYESVPGDDARSIHHTLKQAIRDVQ